MDFHHDSVGARGDRRPRHRDHLVAQTGAVRWVRDDRQMRQLVHDRNGGQIEEIAGCGVEAAHTALAQHDVVVAFRQ